MLEAIEDENWEGYACTFLEWATCVNTSSVKSCNDPTSTCRQCTSKLGVTKEPITCTRGADGRLQFQFPAGGVFPVHEQFTLPPNTDVVGAANPNDPTDKTR